MGYFNRRKWGMVLLAAFLIATGLLAFVNIGSLSQYVPTIIALLAIAAGVLILLDR